MNKKVFALVLALVSINAFAAEGFSGVYAGVHFGYVNGSDKNVELSNGTPDGWTAETKPSGGLAGLAAGYNRLLNNNILLGVEADLELPIASDDSLFLFGGVPSSAYPIKTELKAAFSLRPRLGYLFNGNQTLVFVTAGYGSANIKRTYFTVGGNPPSQSAGYKWQNGWTAGLGLEHFVAKNLTAKVEYRHTDLGSDTFDASAVYGGPYTEKQDYTEQSVRLGLMYHF